MKVFFADVDQLTTEALAADASAMEITDALKSLRKSFGGNNTVGQAIDFVSVVGSGTPNDPWQIELAPWGYQFTGQAEHFRLEVEHVGDVGPGYTLPGVKTSPDTELRVSQILGTRGEERIFLSDGRLQSITIDGERQSDN